MSESASRDRWWRQDHPFYLMVVLCLGLLAEPWFPYFPSAGFMVSLFATLIIISSMLSLMEHRRVLLFLTVVGVPALLLEWGGHALERDTAVESAQVALWIAAWVYIIKAQLTRIVRDGGVTQATLWRAISAYLMMGIAWSRLYRLIAILDPTAFNGFSGSEGPDQFTYFSFTVLTTLGFGDIAPVAPYARALVILEAVVGPMYLAVLLALLVSVYTQSVLANRNS